MVKILVNITYKTQTNLAGTANAISYGKDFIDDNVIVLNGDLILNNEIIVELLSFIIKKTGYFNGLKSQLKILVLWGC